MPQTTIGDYFFSTLNTVIILGARSNEAHVIEFANSHRGYKIVTIDEQNVTETSPIFHFHADFNDLEFWIGLSNTLQSDNVRAVIFDYSTAKHMDSINWNIKNGPIMTIIYSMLRKSGGSFFSECCSSGFVEKTKLGMWNHVGLNYLKDRPNFDPSFQDYKKELAASIPNDFTIKWEKMKNGNDLLYPLKNQNILQYGKSDSSFFEIKYRNQNQNPFPNHLYTS